MAITLTTQTGSATNLNDGTNSYLISIDLGAPARDEVWIEPNVAGVSPILGLSVDRKTKCIITLGLKHSTMANLSALVENIRAEFAAANQITFQMPSGTSHSFKTYPTAIELPPMGDRDQLLVASNQFIIPDWTFGVWRSPTDTAGNLFIL